MHQGSTPVVVSGLVAIDGPVSVDHRHRRSIVLAAIFMSLTVFGLCPAIAVDVSRDIASRAAAVRFVSEDHSVRIHSDFRGGRLNGCVEFGPDQFDLLIKPERMPVNDSAWYAFQIDSTETRTVRLRLRYEGGSHRYRPLISHDRKTWQPIDEHLVKVHPQGTQAIVELQIDERPMWVSAQELLTDDEIVDWSESLLQRPFVTKREIGRSVENRPIHQLEITESKSPSYLVIMARQHPPEVSGAIGMMRFVDAIASDTPIARDFRERFSTIVIPTSNPDGVANGNWRCNANGVDLNRDWGHFLQPETRAIRESILGCRSRGRDSLYLVLDFHSTYEDVFYTTKDVDAAFPKGFTKEWFSSIDRRFPEYEVNHDATHNASRTTSKAWVHQTLDVAAVTYEFGDNTDRAKISDLAQGSAEEMMRLLLESESNAARGTRLIGVQSRR